MKSARFSIVMSVGRRVRACTRLSKAAKALATRDHVRGISGLSAPSNNCLCCREDDGKTEGKDKEISPVLVWTTCPSGEKVLTRCSTWSTKVRRTRLFPGANTSAQQQICSGASASTDCACRWASSDGTGGHMHRVGPRRKFVHES
jgi:hypothetical protein